MKPWLLNILACPIDKHHPLGARLFSWETSEEEMRKIASEAGLPSVHFRKNYEHLTKQVVDGTISIPAIREVEDVSDSNAAKELLAIAVDAATRLKRVQDICEEDLLKDYPEDIDVLYRYLNLIEVASGLLVCSECGRWYPIGSAVETIPEMLPDDLRERERDLKWLEKWRDRVPVRVLENGKPFNLGGR
jgi:uncharacterized protein YbaR (Trm112 family)